MPISSVCKLSKSIKISAPQGDMWWKYEALLHVPFLSNIFIYCFFTQRDWCCGILSSVSPLSSALHWDAKCKVKVAQVCGQLKIPTRKLCQFVNQRHSSTPIFVREQLSDVALQWQQVMEYLGLFPSKSAVN